MSTYKNLNGDLVSVDEFINDYSGVFDGETLQTKKGVINYFTLQNMDAMYDGCQENNLTQSFLDDCSDYYIENYLE